MQNLSLVCLISSSSGTGEMYLKPSLSSPSTFSKQARICSATVFNLRLRRCACPRSRGMPPVSPDEKMPIQCVPSGASFVKKLTTGEGRLLSADMSVRASNR